MLLLALWGAGCSSSKIMFDAPRKLTGVIMIVGNEPFTRLSIRTDEKSVYLIKCGHDLKRMLLANQGKKVIVFYIGIEEKEPADEIDVVRAVIVPN
jgi:hypothetical protein